MTGRFVTSLDGLREAPPRHLLLLYSGGVDGTFLLQCLQELGIQVTALIVEIGSREREDAADSAALLGARLHRVDATAEFFAEFVPPAIHADAYYQGQFPAARTASTNVLACAELVISGRMSVARRRRCRSV